jgi:thiol-disulfide isomerase/thioredoxin
MKWKLFGFFASLLLVAGLAFGLNPLGWRLGTANLVKEAGAKEILEHIKDLNSPLVLVNFWASWCEPCKVEFPNIMAIKNRHAREGLKVIFISIDDPADLKSAEDFLRQHQVNFPTFYKGQQSLKFVNEIYPPWTGSIPMTLLFGKDLKIVDAWEGDTSLEEFETRVQRHLKGT